MPIARESRLKHGQPLTPAQWLPKPASRWFPENSLSLRDQRSPSETTVFSRKLEIKVLQVRGARQDAYREDGGWRILQGAPPHEPQIERAAVV